jgi:signal transduction histidine kinase
MESPLPLPVHKQRRDTWNLAVAIGAAIAYALLFGPAYAATGTIAGSLSVIPIGIAGWLFGVRGGVLASLVSIPLHVILFGVVGAGGWHMVAREWPGSAMGIVLGVATGWLSAFLQRAQAQSRQLARERAALREEIATRERVEQELQQSMLAAEAASRAKSTFLANMSHEKRTPLTTIVGYSELLRLHTTPDGSPAMAEDIDRIQKAAYHLLDLISDVLDLSKIEAGRMELAPETFSLCALVREVGATVQPLMAQNRNSLQVNCTDEQVSIYQDRTKLRQVLLNMLSNAAKFTSEGTVTLEAGLAPPDELLAPSRGADPAPWVVVSVADTGIGMTEDQMRLLFQPFEQANSAITRTYGGTGLGLALSQRFCRLMGGVITVTSTPGAGSTFTVRLPPALALAEDQAGAAPSSD